MRILVIGSTGTIGQAIVAALSSSHEVIGASRRNATEQVDITSADSIRALYQRVGRVDAIMSSAGEAVWKPLAELTEEDFAFSFGYKLMGQVNIIRLGLPIVRDGGSITITSELLGTTPMVRGAAPSLVNGALESFVRAAALEAPRGIRVNSVSPDWVSETLAAMGEDPTKGVPAAQVARRFVESLTGTQTGAVLPVLPR
jgi:NAD(P)-dependent dehydrogenase (short-subunit alcohol dehydrogenase family)